MPTKQIKPEELHMEIRQRMDETLMDLANQIENLLHSEFDPNGINVKPVFDMVKCVMIDNLTKELKLAILTDTPADAIIRHIRATVEQTL